MRRLRSICLVSAAAVALAIGCAKKADDAQLATNIKAQLFSDAQTKNTGVQVTVKDAVVTLAGTVPDHGARYEAYKLATTTPGVTKVNDQMIVQAPEQTAQATPPAAPEPTPTPTPAASATRERRISVADRRKRRAAQRAERAAAQKRARDAARRAQEQTAAPQAPAAPVMTTPAPPPAPVVAAPAAPPPPQPVTAIFPAGTTIEIETVDPVDSTVNHAGDEFQATLVYPLTWNGRVVVPPDTNLYMRLTNVATSGQYKGRSELQLQLVRLEFHGKEYPLVSTTYTVAGGSRGKNTAEKVGGGAVLGAIIGAIAGGGKGAAIGAGVGAAGGGVFQGVTKAKQIRIAPETKLDFKLDQPLDITYLPHARNN